MTTTGFAAVDRLLDLDDRVSPEDRAWEQKAVRLTADLIRPHIEDDFEAAHFRAEILPAFAEAGLLGMHLNAPGCAGAGPISYGLVCAAIEAGDSGWRTFVSVQGSLAMTAIDRFGSEHQRQTLLPEMAAGRMLGCFALTEPAGGSDPGAMTTTAVRDGDEWVLNGAKRWIGLATIADIAIVWARTDDGVRGFVVPTDTQGFTATPITQKHAMRASIQCEIDLVDVRLPTDAVLERSRGLSAPLSCLNEARFGISWGVMGIARECLAIGIDYALERQSFGSALAGKQLVQARLAEMMVGYQNGMLTALHIADRKAAGVLQPAQISIAKLNNVRTAIAIAQSTRELLAGDGVTGLHPVMRHMANLEAVRTYEGTDDIHALTIGRALTGVSAF
ncbi:glutaryl-CoA dehydrogenase [Microbacterium sp. W4I4]|uniref:acyl-CoA dehydrogenase family protein n=1 Tax=Microbacterium sp. W4I4 TaxID=3042295 RepID=UPI00278754FF|nr:acyl-CoA dehydrogenase family protein [Microbacterium sp. W4I4]MDQ0615511.1 glutaryl-CoA dehydrogenase [Microbacterium sp. W4I4]